MPGSGGLGSWKLLEVSLIRRPPVKSRMGGGARMREPWVAPLAGKAERPLGSKQESGECRPPAQIIKIFLCTRAAASVVSESCLASVRA